MKSCFSVTPYHFFSGDEDLEVAEEEAAEGLELLQAPLLIAVVDLVKGLSHFPGMNIFIIVFII